MNWEFPLHLTSRKELCASSSAKGLERSGRSLGFFFKKFFFFFSPQAAASLGHCRIGPGTTDRLD
jgi:hypothetical protein